MLKEFREFAVRGNVVDMAVGIVVGGAFTTVVRSLVDDLIMPPLGFLIGGLDFSEEFLVLKSGQVPAPYTTLAEAKKAGAVVLSYGNFINTVLAFLISAFALFIAIRWINNLRRPESPPAPGTKACTYCKSPIHIDATRCPQCTSALEA